MPPDNIAMLFARGYFARSGMIFKSIAEVFSRAGVFFLKLGERQLRFFAELFCHLHCGKSVLVASVKKYFVCYFEHGVCSLDADLIFAYGKEAEHYAKAIADSGRSVSYFTDKTELTQELIKTLQEGDAILFKASRGLKLEEVIYSIYDRWENK